MQKWHDELSSIKQGRKHKQANRKEESKQELKGQERKGRRKGGRATEVGEKEGKQAWKGQEELPTESTRTSSPAYCTHASFEGGT